MDIREGTREVKYEVLDMDLTEGEVDYVSLDVETQFLGVLTITTKYDRNNLYSIVKGDSQENLPEELTKTLFTTDQHALNAIKNYETKRRVANGQKESKPKKETKKVSVVPEGVTVTE